MNNNLKKVLYNYKNFGFIYGTSFLLHKTIFRKTEWKVRRKAIKILNKRFGYIYEKNKDLKAEGEFTKNIFVFWAQGFDNIPDVCQKCIDSIKNYYSDYKINYIDLNNYNEYVSIDQNIINLFNKGKISIQTFSDVLRLQFIYKYGGVWCDATLLFYNKLSLEEELNKNSFYSLNMDCKEKKNLWGKVYPVTFTTFFFAARSNSIILKAINEAYIEYYKKYDFVIDYFLTDYLFILAMMYKLEDDALNKIPYSEGNTFYLLNNLLNNNKKIDINECKKIPQKITWKNINMDGIEYVG